MSGAGLARPWLAAVAGLWACAPAEAPAPLEGPSCGGESRSPLSAADRKVVGPGVPYPADGTLRGRDDELAGSQLERRRVAWDVVAKVLREVPLAETLPNLPARPTRLPAWQTWYDKDDLRRVFHHLYEPLPVADKEARAHFAVADLDAAFAWNVTAVEELATWPADRFRAYLEAVDEDLEVNGVGGISRVSYSPAAARHLVSSYPEVLGCRDGGAPPPHEVGPVVETPVLRDAILLDACARQVVGSYAVEADETLRVVLESPGDAALVVRGSELGEDFSCVNENSTCEVAGPSTVEVIVQAGAAPLTSMLAITRESRRPAWSACLDGAFPVDAVVVKADYQRADFEMTLPAYATDAVALGGRMQGAASWDEADAEADPGAEDIYTLVLPSGARYRLAALHIMTKELDHWLWTTLWWSPSPNENFGADRPAAVAALEGPWAHYNMCVVSAFEERDPRAGGGFETSQPSLAEALKATYRGMGAPSWCSNPYLERGDHNATTNCVGCHQHGGTELQSEEILTLPDSGRALLRNNFPADYSWSTTSGDELAGMFAEEELYFLGAP